MRHILRKFCDGCYAEEIICVKKNRQTVEGI